MQKKHLLLLFITMFLMMLGFGIIIPVMPFFAKNLGASPLQISILFASYNIMQFIFSPIWGALSDRIGRKPLVLFGLLGFSCTFVLFGLASSYPEMLIYRILSGIISAAAVPTVTAIVADWLPPTERSKGMGIIGAGVGLSFVFGPAIGGVLGQNHYSYPFFASGIVAFITFFFVLAMLPESLPKEKRSHIVREKRGNPLQALTGPLSLMYNVLFIVSFVFAGFEAVFALYINELYGLSSEDLGYMFLVMGIIAAIIQGGFIGKLVKSYGEPTILAVGLFLYVLGFVSVNFGTNFWTFSLVLSLFGAGQGMIRATSTAMITQRTTQGQGITSGTMSSMDSLGRILGPLVAGSLYEVLKNSPFILGAVLMIILLIWFQMSKDRLPKINPNA
ncbi:MFS transporter [Brevibacillus ginsengisoli]|uniref:MFS transporter n=1 Tax=Brevibacillus ginsengisoli TaxID=363854 RepID=UPI003CEED1A9